LPDYCNRLLRLIVENCIIEIMNLHTRNRVFTITTYQGEPVDLQRKPELAPKMPHEDAVSAEFAKAMKHAENTSKYYKIYISENGIHTIVSNNRFV
jgi:hypothetical protein